MKIFLFTLLITINFIPAQGQNFIEHPIDNFDNFIFRTIELQDFDDDGVIDIIGALHGNSQLMIWFGEGSGDFEAPIVVESENGFSARDIEFSDLNNDGIQDIVAITTVTFQGFDFERLVYYINNGDRTFSQAIIIDPSSANSIEHFFSVFDVNNDGLDDIVTRVFTGNLGISYYENLGNGSFSNSIDISEDTNREVYGRDFNNDGLIDILLGGGVPKLLLNNGDATFSENPTFSNYPAEQFATYANSGFIDSDTNEDIFLTNTNFIDTAGVLWFSNDGDGNFTLEENITNESIPSSNYSIAQIIDINGDGHNDLIAGIRFTPGIGIPFWINDGSNNYTPNIIQSTSDDIETSLKVYDFNDDGKMDFIVGTRDGKLTWFENNFTLSLKDVYSKEDIRIFPNPSSNGVFNFDIASNLTLNEIDVFDSLGRKVDITSNQQGTIDLSKQRDGVYFVIFNAKKDTPSIKKIIKF
jgi:hypothetical protein